MEDSASCIWVSVSSFTNVKEGIADLALAFWYTMPRQLHLHRPYLPGVNMWLPLGFCAAILGILALTSVTYSFGFPLDTPSNSLRIHSCVATSDSLSLVHTLRFISCSWPVTSPVVPALFDLPPLLPLPAHTVHLPASQTA